jgi:hypothetical protein
MILALSERFTRIGFVVEKLTAPDRPTLAVVVTIPITDEVAGVLKVFSKNGAKTLGRVSTACGSPAFSPYLKGLHDELLKRE